MELSLLTYNTLYNNGFENFDKIIKKINFLPDIICFQEVNTNITNLKKIEKYGYKLADYENSFTRLGVIYGAATFYKPKLLKYLSSDKKIVNKKFLFEYFSSFISFIIGFGRQKTFLLTDFLHIKSKKKLSVCNIHLFVIGTNHIRIKNIEEFFKEINLKSKINLIICGDFNYLPYQRKKLEKMMKKYSLKEATKNIFHTVSYNYDGFLSESLTILYKLSLRMIDSFIKGLKIDYIFYKGLKLKKTERVEVRYSDHYPIIFKFSL